METYELKKNKLFSIHLPSVIVEQEQGQCKKYPHLIREEIRDLGEPFIPQEFWNPARQTLSCTLSLDTYSFPWLDPVSTFSQKLWSFRLTRQHFLFILFL